MVMVQCINDLLKAVIRGDLAYDGIRTLVAELKSHFNDHKTTDPIELQVSCITTIVSYNKIKDFKNVKYFI